MATTLLTDRKLDGGTELISSAGFGSLFSEYLPRFVDVAYGFVRDREVARDLVSDSFMAFLEIRERLPYDTNVLAYIFTVVKNRCLNHLETNLRHLTIQKQMYSLQRRVLQEDIYSLSMCDPEKMFSDEVNDILNHAIDKMPMLTREVFLNSRFDNLSYAEIASKLNISPRRVHSEISSALGVLRAELRDYLPILLFFLALSSIN